MASTIGDGPESDPEETLKLPPNASVPEQTPELPPAADPFATSINLVVPDAALSSTRTIPLPTPTPAGGTPLPPPPAVPPGGTGWTGTFPIAVDLPPPPVPGPGPERAAPASAPVPVPAHGIGGGLRGRILVIEGGYGGGRRWGRGGSAHASVLSAALAGVAPQVLLSADQVDAVHLPGANDPQTVLAHLRAAARHPGPLLIHLGGHLITDRRGEQLYLSLRENKSSESLPWSAIATELRHRGTELDTLVVGDLSADQVVWPTLAATAGKQLSDGVPLWAVVNHDPDQLGTFTRALIETLHRGRPGADQFLTPELVRQQVNSVLRADTVVITAHPADRPYFRNTARQIGTGEPAPAVRTRPGAGAAPAATAAAPAGAARPAGTEPVRPSRLAPGWTPRGLVSLRKPGVPATPPRRKMIVSLVKGEPMVPADTLSTVPLGKPERAQGPTSERAPEPVVAASASAPARVELGKGATVPDAGLGPDAVPVPGHGATIARTVELPAPADPLAATVPLEKPTATQFVERAPEPEPAPRHDPLAATTPLSVPAAPAAPVAPVAPAAAAAPAVRLGKETDTPPPAVADPGQAPPGEYLEAIGDIVRNAEAGEHDTAAALALALEEKAVDAYGSQASVVLQVRQVRAHVCRVGGLPSVAAELYRQVAAALLRTDGPDHPETQRAVTNAEACWRAVKDPTEAIRIAPEIIELRAHLPGPENRKLRAAERYLRQLAETRG
ncbi:hypothetical protein HUT16_30550 [Kitasatospora sp. NA04385]|uniref:hypothetical protein n=1 Tax=Kitasatospora sp. NA04385 TaxID=2742135 RepID=UPI001591DD9B|nr:hypothetical protein [Kitasatospora sp. NA04385]QKW22856.1 hypothetical protein HUT16_30550 [Kitasatospora sp. NA04385]